MNDKMQVLLELEHNILCSNTDEEVPYNFSDDVLRASTRIFSSILMDFMWRDQEKKLLSMEERIEQVTKCGEEIKQLIDKYTAIDSHQMYDSYTTQKVQ